MNQTCPVACDLGVFTPEERDAHLSFTSEILFKRAQLQEVPEGYTFRFPLAEPGFQALARWAEEEARCCPFFRFALELDPTSAQVTLTVTGPPEGKELLTMGVAEARRDAGGP